MSNVVPGGWRGVGGGGGGGGESLEEGIMEVDLNEVGDWRLMVIEREASPSRMCVVASVVMRICRNCGCG